MDRARDFHFVAQMPRTTVAEVLQADAVYDRQVLLNEPWHAYAARTGKSAASQVAEHDKFVTETWAEWEQRKKKQSKTMQSYDREEDRKAAIRRQHDADRAAKGAHTMDRLMAIEAERLSHNMTAIHTLLLDFELLRAQREANQRADVERQEFDARTALANDESQTWADLRGSGQAALQAIIDELERRRRAKEEEEHRIRMEQQRKADELKAEAERRKREQEEEERRRKEAAEEAKKAERRRKEEERRLRAKAEREGKAFNPSSDGPAAASTAGDVAAAHGGGSAAPSDVDRRNAAREKRLFRMQQEAGAFQAKIGMEAASCSTPDDIDGLFKSVVDTLGGQLLFHTAVYIAVVEGDHLVYKYASRNCSDALRSGRVTMHTKQHATAPTVALCVQQRIPSGVIPVGKQSSSLLYLTGQLPAGATGEFAAFPITATDGTDDVLAVIACDTLSSNGRDAPSTFHAGEEGCYDGPWLDVSASATTLSVLRAVADASGRACTSARKSAVAQWNIVLPNAPAYGWPSLNSIWSALCATVRATGPFDCYVARLAHGEQPSAVVVCHNGATSTTQATDAPSHLLGCRLSDAKSLTLSTFANTVSRTAPHFFALSPNVATDARCVSYRDGAAKQEEALLLVPVPSAKPNGRFDYTIGITAAGAGSITEAMALDFVRFVHDKLAPVVSDREVTTECAAMAGQAADWLSLCTGGANAYVSLFDRHEIAAAVDASRLTIVAASEHQQWLLGKRWAAADGGTSHAFLKGSDPVAHKPVADWKHVKLWNDGLKSAPAGTTLCIAAITSQGKLQAKPYGALYLDNVNCDKRAQLQQGDVDLAATAAAILGHLLDSVLYGAPLIAVDGTAPTTLAVESVVGEERIAFLKTLLLRSRKDLRGVTKDQLLELARYNSPPEVIPKVVAATLIVQGKKPNTVESWEDSRKFIKQALIDKMLTADPTGTKPKSAFFLRARKMTKGLCASDVFSRGSYPASCFFSWTYASLLLRRASDKMRKRASAGVDLDEAEAGSQGTSTTAADQDEDINALPEEDDGLSAE